MNQQHVRPCSKGNTTPTHIYPGDPVLSHDELAPLLYLVTIMHPLHLLQLITVAAQHGYLMDTDMSSDSRAIWAHTHACDPGSHAMTQSWFIS